MTMKLTNSPYSVSGDRKASSHKAWEEGQVEYVKRINRFLCGHLGYGEDGIYAAGPLGMDSYKTVENSTPNMQITVKAGWGFYNGELFEMPEDQALTLNAPQTTNSDRIDVIQINPEDGLAVVWEGVESASPVPPAVSPGYVTVAEIYHRWGETSINDTDTPGEGYITLKRFRANFGGQE